MDKRELPIGVMDSGLGGLSVLREALKLMPQEEFIYYGDSANAPYGTKSTGEIRQLTENCIQYFLEREVKEIIIACNTATSASVSILREKYPELPIIGIEPALKPAALGFPGGNILVTATELTLREGKFRHQLHCYEGKANIYVQPLGRIVEFVEGGRLESPELDAYLNEVLAPWTALGLDAVVLGCTHFPFAKRQIRRVVGERPVIFDGAEGTVREAARQLERRGWLRGEERTGKVTICHSGTDEQWLKQAEELLYGNEA
ncbi:MAG: glutamate racemase [Lachnospiraceae bacterium]|nr:glutamate racemase [Lachnospiraceae bacterium]